MTLRKTIISTLVLALAAVMLVCTAPLYALDRGAPVLYAAAKKSVKKPARKTQKKKTAKKGRKIKASAPAARPKTPPPPNASELAASGDALLDGYNGTDLGVLDRAEGLFRGAIERDPKSAPAYTGLSRVAVYRGYLSRGGFDDMALTRAVALADKALELDPGSGDAYLQRGYILFYLGSGKLALSQAEKAEKAGVRASALYGEIAMKDGDLAEAKRRFGAALAEAGDRRGRKADAYDALGEIAMAEADYATAADMFKSASSLRPDSSWESSNYGLALVQAGRFDEAIEVLGFSLKNHDFPQVRANLALAYLKKGVSLHDSGEAAKAKLCYQNALRYDPDLKPAYRNLAVLYRGEGDIEGLKELCKGLLRRDPQDDWARLTLGELCAGEGSL